MPTVDSLLTEIAERGWTVVNLFQTPDFRWRANLHKYFPESKRYLATRFGVADTAAEALAIAIDHMETAEEHLESEVTSSIAKDFDLATILGDLQSALPVVKRRI